jgi:hypothetical protein
VKARSVARSVQTVRLVIIMGSSNAGGRYHAARPSAAVSRQTKPGPSSANALRAGGASVRVSPILYLAVGSWVRRTRLRSHSHHRRSISFLLIAPAPDPAAVDTALSGTVPATNAQGRSKWILREFRFAAQVRDSPHGSSIDGRRSTRRHTARQTVQTAGSGGSSACRWRGRMGVEPTGAGITDAHTVLKFVIALSTLLRPRPLSLIRRDSYLATVRELPPFSAGFGVNFGVVASLGKRVDEHASHSGEASSATAETLLPYQASSRAATTGGSSDHTTA